MTTADETKLLQRIVLKLEGEPKEYDMTIDIEETIFMRINDRDHVSENEGKKK